MARKSNICKGLLILLVGILGLTCAVAATSAKAQTLITNTISSINGVKDDPNITVVSASASSTVQFSMKYNYIGTWDLALQPIKKVHGRPSCFWAYGKWTNSVKTPVVKSYQETSRADFCWLKHPVVINGVRYTAIKIAGGLTGMPCKNWAIPPNQKQPKPQIVGPVYDVRSLTSVKIPLNVNAHSNASVTGTRNCPGGSLSGTASGTGAITGKFNVGISAHLLLKSKGKVTTAIKNAINQQLKLAVQGRAVSRATANLTIKCGAAPPPVTTTAPGPTTTTTRTITTTTTTSTTPQHSCTLSVANASKSDPYTANASVTTDGAVDTVVWYWDGASTTSQSSATNASHTYPTPPASSNAGDGVTYHISAKVNFKDGAAKDCTPQGVSFFVPAPPPGGGGGPP
ncbi:MAG: hypothetical protein ACREMY_04115, partial [bacterium]